MHPITTSSDIEDRMTDVDLHPYSEPPTEVGGWNPPCSDTGDDPTMDISDMFQTFVIDPAWLLPSPSSKVLLDSKSKRKSSNGSSLYEDFIIDSITARDGTLIALDGDNVDEITEKLGFHPDLPYLSRSEEPLPPVEIPEFELYSLEDATSSSVVPKELKVSESFLPNPFRVDLDVEEVNIDPSLSIPECGKKCLYKAASYARSAVAQGSINHDDRDISNFTVAPNFIFSPHVQGIPPRPTTVIIFESIEPCPFTCGVPLCDIMALKDRCIMGATNPAFDYDPYILNEINVLLKFQECKGWKIKVPIECDCGEMTIGLLALILADCVHSYYEEHGFEGYEDLRLCSLSLSADLDFWYPTFAVVQPDEEDIINAYAV